MEINHPHLGKFKIFSELGRGSFASVYLAHHTTLHYPVALKIFHKDANEDEAYKSFKATKSIFHPLICQNFDIIKTSSGNICIFMEYIDGKTLLDYANDLGHLYESQIKSIFGQLVTAIDYLHTQKIIHRDLKCENIMIDQNKNIRLIDLSFSCPNTDEHSTLCGSPAYIAPEIIERLPYNDSIDIWSLGVIIYAITFGKLPFENSNYSLLFKIITTMEPTYPTNSRFSDNLVDLIRKMLIKNPNKRITIDEIKNHPFFESYFDENDAQYTDQLYSKHIPDAYIIQQMNLSRSESINVINEIKSGQITSNTITYNILYKNMISNKPSQNKKYRKCIKARSEGELPLLFDDQLLKIDKKKSRVSDLGSHSASHSLHNENIVHFQQMKPQNQNQSQHQLLLNGHVQFRRFSSMHKPFVSVGKKTNGLGVRNMKNNVMANNHLFEEKLNVISHLQQTETFEEFN